MKSLSVLVLFILSVLFIWLTAGCGPRMVIRERSIDAKVPEVHDTMPAKLKNAPPDLKVRIEGELKKLPDSAYFEGEVTKVDPNGHVTRTKARFYPNRKDKATGETRPELQVDNTQSPLKVPYADTTEYQDPPKETLWDKFGTAIAIGVFVVIMALGFTVILKTKK